MRQVAKLDCFTDALMGCFAGFIGYAFGLTLTLASVPRKEEGSRHIVDIPWEVFAWLPFSLAMIVGVVLSVALRVRRQRAALCFLVSTCLMIGFCTLFSIQLLRRDYIGKL